MHNKESDEPDKSAEEKALEHKVDQMLSTKPVAASPPPTPPKPPKLVEPVTPTVAREIQTAPKLPDTTPPEPHKAYKLETPTEPPIVIALADAEEPKSIEEPVLKPAEESESSEPISQPVDAETPIPDDPLEDGATNKAVDEIVAKEGDTLLALDDAKAARSQPKEPTGFKAKLASIFKSKRTWAIVLALFVVAMAVPVTRYKLCGLVIKKSVTIVVLDSKTSTPVSGAQVRLDGTPVKTDAYGKARLKASVGPHNLVVDKQYYKADATSYFVGFKTAPAPTNIRLVATGRLVPLLITNKVTGLPISGAEIRVLDTTAKTNAKGEAVVALPTTKDSYSAKVSLHGYNTSTVNIQITSSFVKANNFELTPSGKIYFLSNLNGKIDVVKTNLDGTERKTVLAGTGLEDSISTSLLASRDWRYLVLKARRDTPSAALYLIDTNTDKVTQFDNSESDFNLVGWYGHSFVYDLSKKGVPYWQAGRQIVKAYDADNLQLNQLDQNQAEGDAGNYAYQTFYNFYILNGVVSYTTQWNNFGTADISSKTDSIRAIHPNGQAKKDYQTFPSPTTDYVDAKLYEPQAVYYAVHTSDNKTAYYVYENQAVKIANIESGSFDRDYPTYLLSPSANATFWSEPRDGKNALFLGDSEAKTKKQIASLSEYATYGWFSDHYLLVSKGSSELYIMPDSTQPTNRKPLKITDYYKPSQTYNGYGYGYGGL
ncbi:MAG: hypothetical protein AAB462_00995 [Patescibacteria group bacterium]